MSKFKVGDKVFDLRFGIGEVVNETSSINCLRVRFEFCKIVYSPDGRRSGTHVGTDKHPILWTLKEAREKGYDIPREPYKLECEVEWREYPAQGMENIIYPVCVAGMLPINLLNKKGTLTFVEDVTE